MKEDLLHFIWKYKKLPFNDLVTSKDETVSILDTGLHNHLAGPDFFNAKIKIAEQLWAGNVEVHLKSSDWYAHHHETDDNYNNVILHVVWEDDADIFRKDNSEIPTLELKKYVPLSLLNSYHNLFDKKNVNFINCEKDIAEVDPLIFQNWLERLYFERLEQKSDVVNQLLKSSNNDWEKVLFSMLFKSFGLKINGNSFFSIANALNFKVVQKTRHNLLQLESLFFGLAGFLEDDRVLDKYYLDLKKEYGYLGHKFSLENIEVIKPEFFKLRPPNFPTIRFSQLANLYYRHGNLFSKVINASTVKDIYELFSVSTSNYWENHFTFGKESKKSIKRLTISFIDLIIINALLPLKFCYAKYIGKDANEEIVSIINELKIEDNSIIQGFETHSVKLKNAKDSQASLQLYNEYCIKNRCLQCVVGSSLLNR